MESSRNFRSTELESITREIGKTLRKYVRAGQRIAVAYSGGLDSTVLLHAASAFGRKNSFHVSAHHINHGLSPNAEVWVDHCLRFCSLHEIELRVTRVMVDHQSSAGLEGAAREARFNALKNDPGDWVLLGHHADDQAETVLLNLLRGSAVRGCSAMKERRERYLRPLLQIRRADIERYAVAHNLAWIDDESNADAGFSRNYLRKFVTPLLEDKFNGAIRNIARAALAFGEADGLLDDLARIDGADTHPLPVTILTSLSPQRGANVIAYLLRLHGEQVPGRRRIQEILRQVTTAGADAQPLATVGRLDIRRYRNALWIVEHNPAPETLIWDGTASVPWGSMKIVPKPVFGLGIAQRYLTPILNFKVRVGGETFKAHDNGPNRPVKDLLREHGVPPWLRDVLPILYRGDDVVWIGGIGVSSQFRCGAGEDGIQLELHGANW